ncbi:MerR family transcriptional regulator [Tropicimonas marinistellae]|uniref:MerR family transcriptional regulator n=1 Tax=Tropicimonas marinistellae TaxID=1739787 RepID=UPI00098FCE39|nr:MerR family transcriptional regulator [Tropicimonas marinistellae]
MHAIGEASRQSGVPVETIRYYEREGVISKAGRTASGRRVYTKADIAELRFIRRCRDLGFPLPITRKLLSLSSGETDDCGEVRAFGLSQLAEVHSKIAELQELASALEELTANCAEGSTNCPMLDQLRS